MKIKRKKTAYISASTKSLITGVKQTARFLRPKNNSFQKAQPTAVQYMLAVFHYDGLQLELPTVYSKALAIQMSQNHKNKHASPVSGPGCTA